MKFCAVFLSRSFDKGHFDKCPEPKGKEDGSEDSINWQGSFSQKVQ